MSEDPTVEVENYRDVGKYTQEVGSQGGKMDWWKTSKITGILYGLKKGVYFIK